MEAKYSLHSFILSVVLGRGELIPQKSLLESETPRLHGRPNLSESVFQHILS